MCETAAGFVFEGKIVLPESMPHVFRVMDFTPVQIDDSTICCRATLFHRYMSPRVTWTSSKIYPQILKNSLVSIHWNGQLVLENGQLHIGRLVPAEAPNDCTNLFDTVPSVVVHDRTLLDRGRVLVNLLPRRFKMLFNAIFWDSGRFLWFVAGPSSLSGREADLNGNMRHSIEVAESALRMAAGHRQVFNPLIILGSFLRDAGKAEQYRLHPATNRFVVSERGQLVGHRLTALEWLTVAISRYQIEIPKPHHLALLHILSAVTGAPEWTGLREPQSLEASILSMAERWVEQTEDSGGAAFHLANASWLSPSDRPSFRKTSDTFVETAGVIS